MNFRKLVFVSFICLMVLTSISLSMVGGDSRAPQGRSINEGVIVVSNPSKYDRVFVISDVHGMYDPLVALLKAGQVIDQKNHWIAGQSMLIVTGDSIDKGPKSLEVLNLWIELQVQAANAGGLFVHVLGNHEAEFLSDPKGDDKAVELLAELKRQNVPVTDLTLDKTPRGYFLHSQPLAAVVGRWLFCHSGFYPDMKWKDFTAKAFDVLNKQDYKNKFLIGDNSILEAKDWEKHKSTLKPVISRMDEMGIFGIVFGHQPGAFKIDGRSAAKVGGRLIKIDNGMPPEGGSHDGSLLVFTNPAQMNSMSYPDIQVITKDGVQTDLVPE